MSRIFCVSHVLNGPKERYHPLEKHHNLLVTTRKLKLYFQAHPINVLRNVPLRQVLHKSDLFGRSSKWVLELSEGHISFLPRKIIQGQALADLLVDCIFPKPPSDNGRSHDSHSSSLTWIEYG